MINLSKRNRYLLSVFSGLLMVISYPFAGGLTPLVFVSWLPLLFVESYISKKNYRSSKVFVHAYLSFLIYNLGTTWWVWNADEIGASLAFILNSLLMAITFYFFHLAKKHIGEKEGYISLLFFWIGFEYLHFNWEMSWTWLTLGNTFSIVPSWVQWYSSVGVLGGSLWILIINLLFFRTIQNVYLKKESWRIQTPLVWSGLFLIALPIAISLYSYYSYEEESNSIEVVAIQPNIDPYNEKFDRSSFKSQLETLTRLARIKTTENTALIVAPETSISSNFNELDVQQYDFFKYLVKEKTENLNNTPWYIGASTYKLFSEKESRASRKRTDGNFEEFYNSSMLITADNDAEFVHKSKLVPGVEVLPFSDIFPFLEEMSIDNGGISGTLGIEKHPKVFDIDNITFAPVICYESIYGEWVAEQCRKGAQLICIATNDGWWGDTPGYKQHLSFASLRAIENRRSIVRSANTGISCFVNQRGDIKQATKWWKEDVIRGEVNLNSKLTFYTIYGDVLGRSFSFAAILVLLFTFVKRFRKKRKLIEGS